MAAAGVAGFDQTLNGDDDAYALKLAPDGKAWIYATYIGGAAIDFGNSIAIDSSGAAYITGEISNPQRTSFPNGQGFGNLPAR